jgi:FLVCR family MFS transporter 7
MIEACFTVLTTVLVIIIIRSEPPSPPSPSEEQHLKINIKKDFIGLLTNCQYLLLLFGFSFGYGIFSAITTVLEQLIAPFGYTSSDTGVFGAIVIITGLINACVAGVIMDRTHAYRLILRILLVGGLASGIYFILILQPNEFYPLAVAVGLIGFFLLPLLPVTFECAVESTFPIRAEWSTGLLLCAGSVLGGIFTFVLGALINLAPVSNSGVILTPASIFILCCFVVPTVVMFFYNGPYLRLQAERTAVTTASTDL